MAYLSEQIDPTRCTEPCRWTQFAPEVFMRRRDWSKESVDALNGALGALHELLRLYAGAREQVVFRHPARADVEALRLIEIATVHVDAMSHLARTDIPSSMLPAASASRSAYDVAFIAAWLLGPEDPIERDQRWLGYLDNHARFYRNLAEEFKDRDEEIRRNMARVEKHWADQGLRFAEGLPEGKRTAIAYAGVNAAVPEKRQQYFIYRSVSQLVHGEPSALAFAPLELRLDGEPKHVPVDYSLLSEPAQWGYVISMGGEAVVWPLEIAIRKLSDFDPRFAVEDWSVFLKSIERLTAG